MYFSKAFLVEFTISVIIIGNANAVEVTITDVNETHTATLLCEFSDTNATTITWYKSNNRSANLFTNQSESTNGTCTGSNEWQNRTCTGYWFETEAYIELYNVTVSDEGLYICETDDGFTGNASFTVLVPPNNVVMTGDDVPAGDPVTRTCTVERVKPVGYLTIVWYVNDSLVEDMTIITNDSSNNSDGTSRVISTLRYPTSCDFTSYVILAACEAWWNSTDINVCDATNITTDDVAAYCYGDDEPLEWWAILLIVLAAIIVPAGVAAVVFVVYKKKSKTMEM